ncbi:Hypothetical predicted protein [Pelobates cultripes]|uniref:Beta/gamma crystallin 'Greek key' domain-containing protein n=1 Tax=Pelobates cultripes TaxID=61616 RepID=A0AAD1SF04_PELCU|nr:Hypothetical predicted protein [Pelobates cultripes]
MSKLQLFAYTDMKGDSVSLDNDIPNLASVGFLKRAKSLRVHGDPWVVFSDKNYKGEFKIYKEGDYNSIPDFEDMICSVRVVNGGLYDPQITVYEHINYGGRSLILTKNVEDLSSYEMSNMVSSHKVQNGVWILYDKKHFQGSKMVALAGDAVPNYKDIGWNDKVNSLKFFSPLDSE